MPEGPEIRRAADRIERAIGGRETTQVGFGLPRLRRFQRRLTGRRVTAVEPRGKALLIHFDNDLSIYSHNQLYGRWYVMPAGKLPATRRSLRLEIRNGEKSALLYSASEIDVLRAAELDLHPFLAKLGPDALGPDVDEARLVERVRDPRFGRRQLAALLLDQSFVAGIGNYLRSEILFVAGIHPERRPRDLSAEEAEALGRAIGRVTRQAYRTGGITNDPKRAAELRRKGLRRAAYRHHVFVRAGKRCWTCNAVVRRADLGGRRIYYCPRCQPAARKAARESRRT